MTSAFIIPDITIRTPDALAGAQAGLSPRAQRVLDRLPGHDGQECAVCSRLVAYGTGGDCDGRHAAKVGATKVPRPIPASDRMPKKGVYEEEATLRPSQPPGMALAVVLKGLEDEREKASQELAEVQRVYNARDASMQRHLRKKLHLLFHIVDTKADQIYALYDVLEGQKAAGQELTEDELEVTLSLIDDIATRKRPTLAS